MIPAGEDAGATTVARLAALTSWRSEWSGLRVVVLGLGEAGFAAADTLAELGADVLVIADEPDEERARLIDVIGARLLVAAETDAAWAAAEEHGVELVVAAPHIRPSHPFLQRAAAADLAVWGDVELAWRVRDKTGIPAEWLLVTGSNGKSTVASLAASMIDRAGLRVAPCGEPETPALHAVRDPAGFDVLVVEVSAVELTRVRTVVPFTSVCLNVDAGSADGLETPADALRAFGRVYDDTRVACIYNRADPLTEDLVREAVVTEGARAIGFGLDVPGPSDLGVVDGILCDRAFLAERATSALELTTVEDLALRGLAAPHLVQDVLAAAALARSFEVTPQQIRDALTLFAPAPHTMATVAIEGGIAWVDDGRADTVHAAAAAIRSFPSVVWIVDADADADLALPALLGRHAERLRAVVVIGDAAERARGIFERHAPALPLRTIPAGETGEVMSDAVRLAAGFALDGDVVLLAPAAARMPGSSGPDERGGRFLTAVREVLGGSTDGESAVDHEPDLPEDDSAPDAGDDGEPDGEPGGEPGGRSD